MFTKVILIFALIHLFCIYKLNAEENSPCTLKSGALGICKPSIQHCDLWALNKEGIASCDKNGMICCPTKQSISIQKCMEYMKLKKCDNTNRNSDNIGITTNVYNGDIVTDTSEFPHMVLLGYNKSTEISWECGGTLISEQYILTAAHCLNSRDRAPVTHARLGIITRSNNDVTTKQDFTIIETMKHTNRTAKFSYHDIALLKLDRPVKMTDAVFPACLHVHAEIPSKSIEAVGWGETESGATISEELRKVTLKLSTLNQCEETYKNDKKLPNGIINEMQFCAGGDNKDVCHADSGGPAIIHDTNRCMNSIVGITSGGFKCNQFKGMNPGVYTRVSNYISWIESNVWPEK